MNRRIILAVFLASCGGMLALSVRAGEEKKADAPAAAEPQLSAAQVLTLKPMSYMYVTLETSLQDMAEPIRKTLPELMKTAQDAHLHPGMPTIFIFHGADGEAATKFKLDIGFQVPAGTKAVGEWKVADLPEHRCVSVLYSGPIAQITKAYEKLVPAATDGNRQPTGESRQMYLFWDGDNSPNNVVQVTLGIK